MGEGGTWLKTKQKPVFPLLRDLSPTTYYIMVLEFRSDWENFVDFFFFCESVTEWSLTEVYISLQEVRNPWEKLF